MNNVNNNKNVGIIPSISAKMLGPKYWGSWFAVFILHLLVLLPRTFTAALGNGLGHLSYKYNLKRRRIAEINIDLCFPGMSVEARDRLVRQSFCIYGQSLFDTALVWWARPARLERMVHINGLEHLHKARESSKQLILLTGHFWALDIAGPMISRHYPQIGLINPLRNPIADYLVARGRRRFNGRVYAREQGLGPIIRAMRSGYGFYYLPDEDFGPAQSVFVPFLGTQSATITALPRLARITKAMVLPTSVRRLSTRDGYEVTIHPPLEDFPGDDEFEDTARMSAVLAEMIKAHPEQYMWTFKLFKTRPDGAPSPYN